MEYNTALTSSKDNPGRNHGIFIADSVQEWKNSNGVQWDQKKTNIKNKLIGLIFENTATLCFGLDKPRLKWTT